MGWCWLLLSRSFLSPSLPFKKCSPDDCYSPLLPGSPTLASFNSLLFGFVQIYKSLLCTKLILKSVVSLFIHIYVCQIPLVHLELDALGT